MRRFLGQVSAAAALLTSISAGEAQQPLQRVQIGILECRGGASVGFIVGSVTNLGCVLRGNGYEDRYIATIRKVGLDIGITQETALAWGVYAPVARLGPGDLSGDYAGVQASLESFTFVSHVGVQALGADTVRFRLTTRGGIDPLAHAIALSGKLQPLPAGDNGIPRFQLRR